MPVRNGGVPRTKIPWSGNYCADCCDHDHVRFDANGRCIDCFDHQHTDGRPPQGLLSFLGLARATEWSDVNKDGSGKGARPKR